MLLVHLVPFRSHQLETTFFFVGNPKELEEDLKQHNFRLLPKNSQENTPFFGSHVQWQSKTELDPVKNSEREIWWMFAGNDVRTNSFYGEQCVWINLITIYREFVEGDSSTIRHPNNFHFVGHPLQWYPYCIYNLARELANGTFISSASKQPKNTTPAMTSAFSECSKAFAKSPASFLLIKLDGPGFFPWKSKSIICLKGFFCKDSIVFSIGLFHQDFHVGLFGWKMVGLTSWDIFRWKNPGNWITYQKSYPSCHSEQSSKPLWPSILPVG